MGEKDQYNGDSERGEKEFDDGYQYNGDSDSDSDGGSSGNELEKLREKGNKRWVQWDDGSRVVSGKKNLRAERRWEISQAEKGMEKDENR